MTYTTLIHSFSSQMKNWFRKSEDCFVSQDVKYKWDRSSHTVEKYKQLLVQKGSSLILVHFVFINRDLETVLREDRESLRNMQKHQPRFTEEQKRELSQVHPWIRTGRLPRAINISVSATDPPSTMSTCDVQSVLWQKIQEVASLCVFRDVPAASLPPLCPPLPHSTWRSTTWSCAACSRPRRRAPARR